MVKSQACQTCDQIVTGRNFNYRAALNIIQNEDYLDEVDFNDIRTKRYYHQHIKKRRKKRDLEFTTAFINTYPIFGINFFPNFGFSGLQRRSELDTALVDFTNTQRSQFCEYITNNGVNIDLANFICNGNYPIVYPFLEG